jgi:hypothetical protein
VSALLSKSNDSTDFTDRNRRIFEITGTGNENQVIRNKSSSESNKKTKEPRVLLPSERYPDASLIERHIELETLPNCDCCGKIMEGSGMTEDSEFLTIIPKQYLIILKMRHKYGCGHCHGDLKTAPAPPRIKEGGSLSDEMAIDVAMTKYCDLVPIERYAKMAGHVLHADETPHRMLEGDKKNHWFLWGFSTKTTNYFECHNTRSGDFAHGFLRTLSAAISQATSTQDTARP